MDLAACHSVYINREVCISAVELCVLLHSSIYIRTSWGRLNVVSLQQCYPLYSELGVLYSEGPLYMRMVSSVTAVHQQCKTKGRDGQVPCLEDGTHWQVETHQQNV